MQQSSEPGAPISWDDPSTPDNPQPGYGYIANDTTREETYYFHSDHLGSTSYITDDKGNITQYDAYLPYGELLVDEHSSSEELPYKFNGKELDEETGLYYYGARFFDPRISLWMGTDPMQELFPNTSVYSYTYGNPIAFVDIKGLYPAYMLKLHLTPFYRANYYTFTPATVHLLSLVSNVPKIYIEHTQVLERGFGHYYPFYDSEKGGGAITLGQNALSATINLTPNFFNDDPKSYDNHGFGQSFYNWMFILSHEVKHLNHIAESKGELHYLYGFAKDYIKYGHDDTPREKEADLGSQTFDRFYQYLKGTKRNGILENILKSSSSDKDKIIQIDKLWKEFKEQDKSQKE